MKDRSSCSEVLLVKGVLKICSKFTGEGPCRSVISVKLLCNSIEIALRHGCSPLNLLNIFRTPFTKNTSGWMLLEEKQTNVTRNMKIVNLYPKTSKEFYHYLKLQKSTMNKRRSIKKAVFKIFAIFTGKKLSLTNFDKNADLQACNFVKKRLQQRCFLD